MDIRLVADRLIFSPGAGEWGRGGSKDLVFEITGDEIATVLRAGHAMRPTRVIGTLFGEKCDLEVTTKNNEVEFALVRPTGGRLDLPTHDILMKVVVAIAYNNDQKRGKQ